MAGPQRPVMRYHGGKWLLAPWIIGYFPKHRRYTEAFGGAASVLMQKPRCYSEVYNDLDGEVVNVFRILRQPDMARELERLLRLTPFARDEFTLSYEACAEDPLEQARRTIVRSFMGFGSDSHKRVTGFRSNSDRSGTTPAGDWAHYPDQIAAFAERMMGVVVENTDAAALIETHDSPETLHYVDPPYPHETRGTGMGRNYRHEMTGDQHRQLAGVLRQAKGMVVISGYPCDLYDCELYPDWQRVERPALADGARPRTEVLWLSPSVQMWQPSLLARKE